MAAVQGPKAQIEVLALRQRPTTALLAIAATSPAMGTPRLPKRGNKDHLEALAKPALLQEIFQDPSARAAKMLTEIGDRLDQDLKVLDELIVKYDNSLPLVRKLTDGGLRALKKAKAGLLLAKTEASQARQALEGQTPGFGKAASTQIANIKAQSLRDRLVEAEALLQKAPAQLIQQILGGSALNRFRVENALADIRKAS